MFGDFIRRLTAPAPAPLDATDARLALGALLVRLARSDGDYAEVEKQRIRAILMARYGLDDVDDLMVQCETLEKEAPDTVRFTKAIKDAVPYEDRRSVIAAMWDIVLADGDRDEHENSLMRMVAPLLGVSDQDSNAARRRIENRE